MHAGRVLPRTAARLVHAGCVLPRLVRAGDMLPRTLASRTYTRARTHAADAAAAADATTAHLAHVCVLPPIPDVHPV